MLPISEAKLYGILDLGYVERGEIVRVTEQMLAGGIDVIQLRAKNFGEADIEDMARDILPLTRGAGIPLIVNDFPEIAAKIGADGIHVGHDDLPVSKVREIVGDEMILGKSTHSLGQARAAASETGVDYIGFGPLFATPTKPDYVPIGTEDIAQVHREVELPIFCIGGIKQENAEGILQAGARRLVIVSGILKADDIPGYVRDVKRMVLSDFG